jgi:hypothetical protein
LPEKKTENTRISECTDVWPPVGSATAYGERKSFWKTYLKMAHSEASCINENGAESTVPDIAIEDAVYIWRLPPKPYVWHPRSALKNGMTEKCG